MNDEKHRKRTEADVLTVQMLECNRMVWLCDNLRKALFTYRTQLLDDETACTFYRFERYVNRMYEAVMCEFGKKKCEILNQMTGDNVKFPTKHRREGDWKEEEE